MASKLGVKDRKGVLVNDVVSGSPAAEAGVEELDVITSFDGQPVDGPRSLQEVVERSDFDKPHRITLLRDGRKSEVEIAVRPLPDKLADAEPARPLRGEMDSETYYSKELGLEVRDKGAGGKADPFADFDGVVIDRVDEGGLADQAGLGPAMLVRRVGRTPVTTIAEFAAAVERESLEEGVMLSVRTARGNSVILLKKGG